MYPEICLWTGSGKEYIFVSLNNEGGIHIHTNKIFFCACFFILGILTFSMAIFESSRRISWPVSMDRNRYFCTVVSVKYKLESLYQKEKHMCKCLNTSFQVILLDLNEVVVEFLNDKWMWRVLNWPFPSQFPSILYTYKKKGHMVHQIYIIYKILALHSYTNGFHRKFSPEMTDLHNCYATIFVQLWDKRHLRIPAGRTAYIHRKWNLK